MCLNSKPSLSLRVVNEWCLPEICKLTKKGWSLGMARSRRPRDFDICGLWDKELHAVMDIQSSAISEEAIVSTLLGDLSHEVPPLNHQSPLD